MRATQVMRCSFVLPLFVLAAVCGGCGDSPPEAPTGPQVYGQPVTYQGGGEELHGYMAWDRGRGGPRPGVLVVHEWWGHNDYARKRADQLAELGYTALALDMYGEGKQASHPSDAGEMSSAVMADMDVAQARFEAALELLKAHDSTDPERVAAIGYCFGGAVVLHMARRGVDLDAVASFHGMLATQTPAREGAVRARILVSTGAEDPFVPPEQVEQFEAEMNAAGAKFRVIRHAGAVHSYTNPGATAMGEKFELPLAYDAQADADSWAALLELLREAF